MIEVQVFIPTADNAGVAFPPAHHALFEQYLSGLFGAFSLLPGTVAGTWAASGLTYTDQLRVYVIGVSGILERAVDLLALVGRARAHYGQLAIYVRYLGIGEAL